MATTPARFRTLALALPQTVEGAHQGHADFRVGGKIFATLGYPDPAWGMVKLTPEQQETFLRVAPDVFVPAKGAWGRQGSTTVHLQRVSAALLRDALAQAWRNLVPAAAADSSGRAG